MPSKSYQNLALKNLAPYAARDQIGAQRFFKANPSPTRSDYQRDRDRLIHSTAFRRLKHKTQVFLYDEGDLYRTRLTHTIEVAQLARALARSLRLDEDLAEAISLAHDFGHTPFGHAGERALDRAMANYGGFDHNAQTFRVVTQLEQQYADYDGLNLTYDTLEGLIKHNGPLNRDDLPFGIASAQNTFDDFQLETHASLEAQCAAIADDIAYNAHDIDDALRAGLIEIETLKSVPALNRILTKIEDKYPTLDASRKRFELGRALITQMVEDTIDSAQSDIDAFNPKTIRDVRQAGKTLVHFSPAFATEEKLLKSFMFAQVYRHHSVLAVMDDAEEKIGTLFENYMQDIQRLPETWANDIANANETARARTICDFIAGMTDRMALAEHKRWNS